MKIYNEVITQFNDATGLWETLYEDGFDYNGYISLAQGAPPHSTAISAQDTVTDTIKTTAGYFTNGDGTLSGTNIHTGSLADSNKKYYFNVTQLDPSASNAEVQFSVAYGDVRGSGSNQFGDSDKDPTTLMGETQAIYKQFANLLIAEPETSGGFKISANAGGSGQLGAGVRDEFIYIWIGKRDRFKDRPNKKAWTMRLSGSNSTGSGVSLSLTDDSKNVAAIATPGGPRYNIVSGSLGAVHTEASSRTYGWFYPERGVMVFSGEELSASIAGGPHFGNLIPFVSASLTASNGSNKISASSNSDITASLNIGDMILISSGSDGVIVSQKFQIIGMNSISDHVPNKHFITMSSTWTGAGEHSINTTGSIGISTSLITASFSDDTTTAIVSSSGFTPNTYNKGNPQNALRFVNCMRNVTADNVLQLRSEEDATQESYFCRIRSNDYNFTSNPTFVSGGLNKLRHETMIGNPTTFITGIGLYNSAGQLLAIAEMSKPIKKNFASEATIKVKLTY